MSGRAKNAFTSAVASAGERPPTSTWLATVTPAGIVVGRGGRRRRGVVGGGVVTSCGGVVVVVGGGVVVVGGGAVVVVPSSSPVSAVADGVAASSTAESRPAARTRNEQGNCEPCASRRECSHGSEKTSGHS